MPLALLFLYVRVVAHDHRLVDTDVGSLVDFEQDVVVPDLLDGAVDAAGGDHLVARLGSGALRLRSLVMSVAGFIADPLRNICRKGSLP